MPDRTTVFNWVKKNNLEITFVLAIIIALFSVIKTSESTESLTSFSNQCEFTIELPAADSELQTTVQKFRTEMKSGHRKCIVLIFQSKNSPKKIVVSGFDDNRKFKSTIIYEFDIKLLEELKKTSLNNTKVNIAKEIGLTLDKDINTIIGQIIQLIGTSVAVSGSFVGLIASIIGPQVVWKDVAEFRMYFIIGALISLALSLLMLGKSI